MLSHTKGDEYRTIAPVYDIVTKLFLAGPHRRMAELCQEYKVQRLLDIGCGTGMFLQTAAHCFAFAAGLELSSAMLYQAMRNSRKGYRQAACHGSGSLEKRAVSFIRGSGLTPPFRKGSFDAVTYSLILHETQAGAAALLGQGFLLAPLAVVLEWKKPERNLELMTSAWVPCVERLAGKGHYSRYRQFMRGGIFGLAQEVGATVEHVESLHAGTLALAVLSKK